MNKEPHDITIENAAFSLTIHWNPEIVLTQACIFGACVLAILFVPNAALVRLAKWAIFIDLASLVFSLFYKREKKPKEEKKEKKKKEEVKEDKPASVEQKPSSHTSSHNESGNMVRNKLEIATPKVSAPKVEKPVPVAEPVAETATAEPTIEEPADQPMTSVPDDVRAAFEDFFSFDFDDE